MYDDEDEDDDDLRGSADLYSAYEVDEDDPEYAYYTRASDGLRVYMPADPAIEESVAARGGGAPNPPDPSKRLMIEGGDDPVVDENEGLDDDGLGVSPVPKTLDGTGGQTTPPRTLREPPPEPPSAPGLLPATQTQQTQTQASSSETRSGALPDEMVQRHTGELERTTRAVGEAEQDAAITKAARMSARAGQIEQIARDRETAGAAAQKQADDRANLARAKVKEITDKPITNPWDDAGVGGKILGAIGIFLGGLSGYMRGGENEALKSIDRNIKTSIDLQVKNKDDQIQQWTRELGSAEAAKTAAELKAWEGVKMRLEANLVDEEAQDVLERGSLGIKVADAKIADLTGKLEREAYGNLVVSEQSGTTGTQGSTMARPTVPKGAGRGGAKLSGGPNVLPVGAEDESPEVREKLAAQYNPDSTTERGQMNLMGKEQGVITKQKQTLERLEQAYGVKADRDGKYPEDGDYVSSATGVDPFDSWDETDASGERARTLEQAWTEVETVTREGWKTEPNGEVNQIRLSGVSKPARDADVPRKLAELRTDIERREKALQSGILPSVRAAYKLQSGAPYKGDEERAAPPPERVPFKRR